jgi:uncharacterized Zn-binding protein involved in type VI secretion
MCPAIATVGDLGSAHGGFPATPILSGSPDVLIAGRAVARQGDPLLAHRKPKHGSHGRQIMGGETSILVNGQPVAVSGCAVSCGGVVVAHGHVEGG